MEAESKDRGYKSRKMVMAYVVMLLGTLGFAATGLWPALTVAYAEYCIFLLGASSIYVTGNAAIKVMTTRQKQKALAESAKARD
ncbi:hypothetical protein [Myxococcus phage Mx1]|nr:hypothetical protein [Myxococcus phage Mx1]